MKSPQISFVLAVESGYFEAQALVALESLRKFGGNLGDCPVFAVTPRKGPRLTRRTLQAFERLNIQYVREDRNHPLEWTGWSNKILAFSVAEERATTPLVAWLDSDVMVLAEPSALLLEQDEDFGACCWDVNIASTGDVNEPNYRAWRDLCELCGLDWDTVPMTTTQREGKSVKLAFNSGVFVARRGFGFAARWLQNFETMHARKISYRGFFGDQEILGFTALALNMKLRFLAGIYNHSLDPDTISLPTETKLLHYHGMLSKQPDHMFEQLRVLFPAQAEWLRARYPVDFRLGGLRAMLYRRLLAQIRNRKRIAYRKHFT